MAGIVANLFPGRSRGPIGGLFRGPMVGIRRGRRLEALPVPEDLRLPPGSTPPPGAAPAAAPFRAAASNPLRPMDSG